MHFKLDFIALWCSKRCAPPLKNQVNTDTDTCLPPTRTVSAFSTFQAHLSCLWNELTTLQSHQRYKERAQDVWLGHVGLYHFHIYSIPAALTQQKTGSANWSYCPFPALRVDFHSVDISASYFEVHMRGQTHKNTFGWIFRWNRSHASTSCDKAFQQRQQQLHFHYCIF